MDSTRVGLERLNDYVTPTQDGGSNLALDEAFLDILTIAKAGGLQKEHVIDKISVMWDELYVEVNIPERHKQ